MINKKISLIAFLFLSTISISCTNNKLPKTELTITKADGSTIPVTVEIAKNEEDRNHGFMNRKKIPDGTGMIFVFENDQILSFWMKNTPHPLSIAYIDSRGKIRDIFNMTPYNLSAIKSTCMVRYALEVPQGWYKENNIKPGDYINLPDSW